MWGIFEAFLGIIVLSAADCKLKLAMSVAPLSSIPCWETVLFFLFFSTMLVFGCIPSPNMALVQEKKRVKQDVLPGACNEVRASLYICSTYGYSLRTNRMYPTTTQFTAASFCLNNRGREPRGRTSAICHKAGDLFHVRQEQKTTSSATKLRINQIHHYFLFSNYVLSSHWSCPRRGQCSWHIFGHGWQRNRR